jgi:trigger factor
MEISKHQLDDLNAVISIEVMPEDYQERVNTVVRKYQKTANIPGFRPGHVPAGIIKKMHGKALLVDELNRLLGETLGKYIYDNKLDVIGTPLPKPAADQSFEEGKNFKFDYEVGLAPAFELRMPSTKTPYYLIKVDDKMVDDDINDMRRRYGKFSNPETSDETSILYGEFAELDENGELKEGGNKTTTTLAVEMVHNKELQSRFIGLKTADEVKFNPSETFSSTAELTSMLRLEKDSPALKSSYLFKVMTVNKIEKAELNQEFFDKIFGPNVVHDEEELKSKVRERIASYFEKESDRKLKKDLKQKFLEEISIPLPDEFLKRMLKANQEKEVDEETFEHEYYHIAEDLRWNLIHNKIAQEQSITVETPEVEDLARAMVQQQFAQYGMADPDPAKLEEVATNYLNESNNAEKLERMLQENKVFDYLKKEVKLDMVELPFEQFREKLSEKTEHEHAHH